MQHQDRRADIAGIRRIGGVQVAVEGHETFQRRPGASQFEDAATAEAEADGAQAGQVQRHLLTLRLERLQPGLGALAHQRPVGTHGSRRGLGLFRIGRADFLAVHVGDEDHIALTGNLLRLLGGGRRDTEPVRHHQQAGTRVLHRIVIDQGAFEGLAVDLVGHGLDDHRGGSRPGESDEQRRKQPSVHGKVSCAGGDR
ncbi:hypothetical protein D9M71_562380 [compost metagenome]